MPAPLTRRIKSVQPSATLKITALAKALKAEGKKVINLAGGEPDFDTADSIKAAAIQAIQEGFTKYTPTTGIPDLKAAITEALKSQAGLAYGPDQIAVTAGAKQALYNALQVLIQDGDEVLIPSPFWVSYPEMVRLAGGTPVEVKTDPNKGFVLQAQAIEAACTEKTRCLILNSPANPTGAVLSETHLKAIAQAALKKDLWIVSDEIYRPLSFDGPALSIASVVPEVYSRTLVVDGVSKAYAMTGWRIGYLAGPVEVVKACSRLQDHATSCPSSVSQRAALAALTGDQTRVSEMVKAFKDRRDLLVSRISKMSKVNLPAAPAGAFYAFADISETGLSSVEFAERFLKEAEVAAVPGSGFGWDDHLRLSFCLETQALEEGLDRLKAFTERL